MCFGFKGRADYNLTASASLSHRLHFPSSCSCTHHPCIITVTETYTHTLCCNVKLWFDPDLPFICLAPKVYEVDMCLHICSPFHFFPVTTGAGLTRVYLSVYVDVCLCVSVVPTAELHNSFQPRA
ncbi:hypothetical protein AMECASPLE_023466 [Ameca splendens]|uniref:Uncharacterized protein n=1 Tax=Ameca splendens TaxID=208324 RepID=A0ABV0Z316_9TELE